MALLTNMRRAVWAGITSTGLFKRQYRFEDNGALIDFPATATMGDLPAIQVFPKSVLSQPSENVVHRIVYELEIRYQTRWSDNRTPESYYFALVAAFYQMPSIFATTALPCMKIGDMQYVRKDDEGKYTECKFSCTVHQEWNPNGTAGGTHTAQLNPLADFRTALLETVTTYAPLASQLNNKKIWTYTDNGAMKKADPTPTIGDLVSMRIQPSTVKTSWYWYQQQKLSSDFEIKFWTRWYNLLQGEMLWENLLTAIWTQPQLWQSGVDEITVGALTVAAYEAKQALEWTLDVSLYGDWNPNVFVSVVGSYGIADFHSSGTSSAHATGASLSLKSAVGSALGSSNALGVGAAVLIALGTAQGVGTASASGSALASGLGASGAASTGSAVGSSLFAAVGSSAGSASTSFIGGSLFAAVGSAAGSGSTSFIGGSLFGTVGSAAGTSTGTAVGSKALNAVGTAQGVSTGSGVGTSLSASSGSSVGSATGSFVGSSIVNSAATAAGTSTGSAVGSKALNAVGTANGSASTSFVGAALFKSVGSAAGSSTASAVGVGSGGGGTGGL